MEECRKTESGSPRPKTPEGELIRKYMKVARCHRGVMERCLSSTGVYRSQHRILMCISDHPNISQRDLARLNDVTTATMAVTLSKLEKGGYIRRAVDEKDKRFNQTVITEKGEKVVQDSRRIFRNIEETMFAGFSEEDFERMSVLFDRILENLKSIDPENCRGESGEKTVKEREETQVESL